MADPKRYAVEYSFSGFQANSPQIPLPATRVDNELQNIEASLDSTIDALMDIRRSDGKLKNGIVGADALSPEIQTGVAPAVDWTSATVYDVGAVVFYGTAFYRALVAHTSGGSFSDDFAAGKWLEFADLGPVATEADAARDEAVAARDVAVASAGTATSAASSASTSAGTATSAASSASTSAGTATSAASSASTSADTATTKAGEAAVSAAAAAAALIYGFSVKQRFSAADGNLTAGQTTFTITGGYAAGEAMVFRNGAKLANGTEVTVSSGTDIVLATGAGASDVVEFLGFGVFVVADALAKTQNGADIPDKTAFRANVGAIGAAHLRGWLAGLTLANNGGAPNTAIDVAAGVAASDDASVLMSLVSGYTKTTGTWAVGSGNGALDTGTVANSTWYHVFLIERPDTGVVDVLLSTSATAPTMPTNYTKKRRIGSIRTNGSAQIIAFKQVGDEFLWAAAVADVSTTTLSTTATLYGLTVPTGVQVVAKVRGFTTNASAINLLVNSPDENSVAANSPAGNTTAVTNTAGYAGFDLAVRTNTTGQIRAVSSAASTTLTAATYGWVDTRGRNA